jgi:integrase/recombinase XerD
MSQPLPDPSPMKDTGLAVITTPLEQLVVLQALSGKEGINRAQTTHRQLSADTDREAVLAWLAGFADSPNTQANCRREAERLLLWSLSERGKPLSSLTHEDLLVYQRFLGAPPTHWVMNGRKLPRSHPHWRPFAGPLSPASQRQAMVVLNSMLSWLVQAGYLAGNPLALSRTRRKSPTAPRVERFLEEDLWAEVRTTVACMPRNSTREQATHARARWLLSLLYLCGLRISEVAGNRMGDFFCRADRHGEPRWWLQVLGKGGKERLVPATNELMVELSHYRRLLGLTPLPQEGENAPVLFPVWWRAPTDPYKAIVWPEPLTRAAIHGIVKDVFAATAVRLLAQGPDQAMRAHRIQSASSHWLRHTMASRLANDVDLLHVRDTLGHASISTTSIYLHTEDDQRHTAISASHRLGWDVAPTTMHAASPDRLSTHVPVQNSVGKA